MKISDAFRTITGMAGRFLFALALLALAITVGFVGTAVFVYHQLGREPKASVPMAQRRAKLPGVGNAYRRVTANSTDVSHFTYADNNAGQPTALTRRAPVTSVPAALTSAESAEPAEPVFEEPARLASAPRAQAVEAAMPEVRVATPVAVRRALPVEENAASAVNQNFNVNEYLAVGRPVLRARPVNRDHGWSEPTVRVYRLSEDSRTVSAN